MDTTFEKVTFMFSQESNCLSDKEAESIEIQYVSDIGIDRSDDGFFIIKTDEWAVDNIDELEKMFNKILAAVKAVSYKREKIK
jgi:hypothetical protein